MKLTKTPNICFEHQGLLYKQKHYVVVLRGYLMFIIIKDKSVKSITVKNKKYFNLYCLFLCPFKFFSSIYNSFKIISS